MSAKGADTIQVCIKLRPREPYRSSLWQVKEGRSIQPADGHAEPSVFDYVFDEGASNQEVFDRMAQHIVRACMQGFNGTIFAYGQTSSGKTYTMIGDDQNPGVMVLAAKEIFQQIANETERDFLLRVGYIEIYNEKIYDLLNKKNQDLKIHEASNGTVNVNCEETIITSEDELLRLFCPGNKERTVGEAHINERSGRSHAILRITIESRKSDRSDSVIQSVLNLVDLAGHERVDPTSATGSRVTEGVHINKSLMFLSNVIKILSDNVDNKFISFRDSKLTRILQASLSGNGVTSIICTIKPSIMEESQSTLNFAMLAKKIRIKPQVNEMVSDTMMRRLDREINELKGQLSAEKRKNESQLKVQLLEGQFKAKILKIISSVTLSERRQQKRRRTSCLSTSDADPEAPKAALASIPEDSRLPRPSKLSQLRKPIFVSNSLVAPRRDMAPKSVNVSQPLKDEFSPTERVVFSLEMPKSTEDEQQTRICQVANKVQALIANCDALQVEVTALTASNQAANVKIEAYEEQVKTLKQTIKRLEMENREAVNLKQQFDSHKVQSKQLEADLLTAITEKDSTIESLQQSLKELSRDVLRNSKEEHMRFVCPELESSCERICNKCQELVSLLPVIDGKDFEKIASESDQLRSEIAATRAKLESFQTAFSQASCEVMQKTDDCERLTRQISSAHNDFGLLQERYDMLEQQSQSHKSAIENMKADYQAIQQKYQKLQKEYESLGHTSNASEEQCQQLQADNTRLQVEIGTLKERVEEAQRELMQTPSLKALAREFKSQNEVLKAKLADMESDFNKIQEEYNSLSNQLIESVQENDALREELKQRTLPIQVFDSMKSSGVDIEFGDPEQDPYSHSNLQQEFAQLSASIHQIELKNHAGIGRLFRAANLQQELDENVTGFKLCLESAKHIEVESHQADASDGIHLKGVLKHQLFQLVALSQEHIEAVEEKRLLHIISQLEMEIEEKTSLYKAKEAQVSNLQSALLETNALVTKVDEYQRQIDHLEMQNNELLSKVLRESTMGESMLQWSSSEDTLVAPCESPVKPCEEGTDLAELKTKVCVLQAEMESQSKQMQLKDRNITELKVEIEEMGERCLSSQLKLVEVETDVRQKQQLLDRQNQKLSDDALLIDQLQEKNAKLAESLNQVEARQEQTIPSSEYEKQIDELRESLRIAKNELIKREKLKTDEINALQLEYMVKMETSENENRAKFRGYTVELEESKERYEGIVATLKEQLMQAGEEHSRVTSRHQAEMLEIQEKISEADKVTAQHQADIEELRNLKEKLLKAAEQQKQKHYSTEVKDERARLQVQIKQADEERQEALKKLAEMRSSLEEAESHKAAKAEHDLALNALKVEKDKLQEMYNKCFDTVEHLKTEMRIRDQVNVESQLSFSQKDIQELQGKCEQQAQDLDNLRQDKINLQLQIDEANELHLKEEARDLEEKVKAFTVKIDDIEESLQTAQLKVVGHEDLVSEHKELVASSNEQIKELQEKYEQLAIYTDNLREEKSILQVKIKEADAQHSCTLKKLHELEIELDDMSKQKVTEKSDLQERLETLTAKISDLEAELQSAKLKADSFDYLISEHEKLKVSLSETAGVSSNLQEKVDNLQSQLLVSEKKISNRDVEINELRSELKHALDAKDTVSAEQLSLATQLKALEEKMYSQTGKFEKEVADLNGSLNELQLKLRSLQERKDELESDNGELKVKLRNAHNLQNQLEEEQKLCASLRAKFDGLGETKTRLEEQLRVKEAEVNQKCSEMSQKVELGRHSIGELTKECDKLRCDLQTKTISFQSEKESLDSTISTLLKDKQLLEEKIHSLNLNGDHNADLMTQLRVKDAESQSLREALINHKLATDAANKKCLQMEQKVEALTKDIERLRTTMKSKDTSFLTERERMNATISSLLEDKRNLEEKQCTLNEIVTKLEAELTVFQALKINGGNLYFESNGSTATAKALTTNNLDRHTAASVTKKSIIFSSAMRKDRRITAHDEHRKQSYLNDSRDFGTMTDPEDSLNLNFNLQASKQELHIRDSQVIALNMELKEENEKLKSRVLEEQDKAKRQKKKFDFQKKEIAELREKYELAKKAMQLHKDELVELRLKVACLEKAAK